MKRRDFVTVMFASFLPGAVALEGSAQSVNGRRENASSRESESLAGWELKVVRRVKVATGISRHRAFPGIEKLRNGDILVAYREGSDHWKTPDGVVRLVRSKDGGLTWSDPKTVLEANRVDYGTDLGITQLSDGTILLPVLDLPQQSWGPEFHAYNVAPWASSSKLGPWRLRAYLMRSTDNGETWSSPEAPALLNYSSDFWWNTYGKIHQVENSETVFWLTCRQKKGEAFWRTGLLVSRDLGRSWTEWHDVAVGLADEKSIIRISGGRLLALVRDLKPPHVLWQTESSDNGMTWMPYWSSGFLGQAPCLFRTRKGVLLCAHRKLDPGAPVGVGLNYSFDEGRSWQETEPLYVSPDHENFDCSYPGIVQLESGEILCVYYTTYLKGTSDIEGVFLAEG